MTQNTAANANTPRPRIAVVGYGSQGRAHALNLRESGFDVTVGLRPGGPTEAKAQADGFTVKTPAEAVAGAELVAVLTPDMVQPRLYREAIEPYIAKGACLLFAHGFNVHYGQIAPRADLDVILVAPKGPGALVRREYEIGRGVPCVYAVQQDTSGRAEALAQAYAAGLGGARANVIKTTFKEETETDLFGEQAVLCGGTVELIKAGFDTLVDAGYAPEMAYFECLHELKLIVDLIYEGGIANMNYSISNNAEFGEYETGPKIVTDDTRAAMRQCLTDIQNGEYAKRFILENAAGAPTLTTRRRINAESQIEQVGGKLRAMMPWIAANKLVDKSKN